MSLKDENESCVITIVRLTSDLFKSLEPLVHKEGFPYEDLRMVQDEQGNPLIKTYEMIEEEITYPEALGAQSVES